MDDSAVVAMDEGRQESVLAPTLLEPVDLGAAILSEAADDIRSETTSLRSPKGPAGTLFQYPRTDEESCGSNRSLYDSDVVYHWIGGRRFCGDYYMPNDEDEQDRLHLLHGVFLHLFNHELTLVPLHNPTKILDIGTGSGEWAIAMGELYPAAEVIGTDIAKIQPSAVPQNVFMEIDDADVAGGWTWNKAEFDLVHFRYMAGAFRDWNHIYNEAFRVLKPGTGWIEVGDFDQHKEFRDFFSEGDNVIVHYFLDALAEAQTKCGRPRTSAHLETAALLAAGFVDVQQRVFDIPMGTWPDDPQLQLIGKHMLIAQLCATEAMCIRPLVETLGWDREDVMVVCRRIAETVRSIARDPVRGNGLCFKLRVVTGRKPFDPEVEAHEGGLNANAESVRQTLVDEPAINGDRLGADAHTAIDINSKGASGIDVRPVHHMAAAEVM